MASWYTASLPQTRDSSWGSCTRCSTSSRGVRLTIRLATPSETSRNKFRLQPIGVKGSRSTKAWLMWLLQLPLTLAFRQAIYKDQKELVGIKEPRNELIKWLSDKDGDVSKQKLKIISIVGFGGLGKTTLAKVVYDKLHNQFHPRAFVSVGRNPDVKSVLKEILRELGYDSSATSLNEKHLIDELHKLLRNKRYVSLTLSAMHDQPAYMVMGLYIVIKCRIEMVTEEDEWELIKISSPRKNLIYIPFTAQCIYLLTAKMIRAN